jgi:hypothetical protein
MRQKYMILVVFAIALINLIAIQPRYVLSDPFINKSNATAEGGNTTWLSFDQHQQTDIWQGFFGRVSGGITLDDASNNTFYDWNLVRAQGEVLATREFVFDWSYIRCTNQTEIYQEELRLTITNDSTQGINDTYFNLTHPPFVISGLPMSGCRSTKTHNSTDSQAAFWNVLLNVNWNQTVYTAIMDDDVVGYNGSIVDFQLLVPTNATSHRSSYNIYLELT